MKVVDCFIFFNELDMLEFRLKYLYDTVDYFVLVESTVTHTGISKPLHFQENKGRFTKYVDKIIHVAVDDMPAHGSALDREIIQRNCIHRGISRLELTDEDIIHISDCDEIPSRNILKQSLPNGIHSLVHRFYYYNFTNLSTDYWNYAKLLNYRTYTQHPYPQKIRIGLPCASDIQNGGWHFSYFGSPEFIQTKLQNFSHQEYNHPEYTDLSVIKNHVSNGDDMFGRDWHRLIKIPYDPATLPEHHELLLNTKILVLRIYNSTPEYDAMWKLHQQHDNSIAIVNDPTLETEYSFDVSERMFKVKGEEGLFRILHKTVKAFEYFLQHFEFDYIVRSNMSTVIDMNVLKRTLAPLSGPVYGGHEYTLTWICEGSGVTHEFHAKHHGLKFIQGTSIVLSRDMCQYIVDHQKELDHSVVDDVSIGILLKDVPCTRFQSQFNDNGPCIEKDRCFYRFQWWEQRLRDVSRIEQQYQLM